MKKTQVITVSAFIYKDAKVFIAKRAGNKEFLPGKFELPGGHVEFGETPEEALKREMQEEFQIDIVVGNPFYAFTYVRDCGFKHAIEVGYFVTLVDPEKAITLNPQDHSDYKWIAESEIDNYLPEDEETEAVRKGFYILKNIPEMLTTI